MISCERQPSRWKPSSERNLGRALPTRAIDEDIENIMANPFFDQPILNSPYEGTQLHWDVDSQGQSPQEIIEAHHRAKEDLRLRGFFTAKSQVGASLF